MGAMIGMYSSVDDGCDDWGVSICRTASAYSVPSLELSSQRNELLRYKELDTRRSQEMPLSSRMYSLMITESESNLFRAE